MPIHQLRLISRQEVAKHTLVLVFEKPAHFSFLPGQYGGFTLINPPKTDANGTTRRFSLLSAPHDEFISIATRVQNSAYKHVLKELPLGSEIKFAGPTGVFTLHENATIPAVFIAGGIGITPFYSMIRHAVKQQSPQHIHLFYGNQTRDDAAFIEELTQTQEKHPHFNFIATMANPDTLWQGEKGLINSDMIKKYIADLSKPIYYVCGSPTMVNALQTTLTDLDISKDKIRIEDFPGY